MPGGTNKARRSRLCRALELLEHQASGGAVAGDQHASRRPSDERFISLGLRHRETFECMNAVAFALRELSDHQLAGPCPRQRGRRAQDRRQSVTQAAQRAHLFQHQWLTSRAGGQNERAERTILVVHQRE